MALIHIAPLFVNTPMAAESETAYGGKAVVYTWGTTGRVPCLGHSKVDAEGVAPFPVAVAIGRRWATAEPIGVAAGENASACVLADGALLVWGAGRGGRLGLGHTDDVPRPTRVEAWEGADSWRDVVVSTVAIGQAHMVAAGVRAEDGTKVAYAWGKGLHGALGAGSTDDACTPRLVRTRDGEVLQGVIQVCAGYAASMAVTEAGELFTWGYGQHGKTGHGSNEDEMYAKRVEGLAGEEVVSAAMGTLCAGAVTADGGCYTWGYGKYGNLGLGSRTSFSLPQRVEAPVGMTKLALTVCQINPKASGRGGVRGQEGPHALAVGADGAAYSWGTCHKGMLGNVRGKILAAPYDELRPYRIGSCCRDEPGGEGSGYLADEEVIDVAASSIHSALLTASGRVFTFGCASGGRMGVAQYMTGLHGGRSRMKCYISAPTAIEAFDDAGVHVLAMGTSRRHMIALGCPRVDA